MIKKFNIDRSLYCDCSVFLIAGFSAMRYQNKIARSNVCALILNFRKSMFRYRSLYILACVSRLIVINVDFNH